jgi:serine phosphatase RsbU (regulator of sigma subunit)
MFYGVIDTDANCLLYASAAAPPPLIFPDGQPLAQPLNTRGFPLGVTFNAVYENRYTPFSPKDLLLIYSDCLIETYNHKGEFLNEEDICETVRKELGTADPAKQSIKALTNRLFQHNSAPIADDLTINAYWRCPPQN